MNKNNNLLPTELPSTSKSFQIDIVGEFTKKRFLGDFTCEIPRIKEQCLIEKHEAFLNGEMADHLSPGVRRMHKMIAYLRFALTTPLPKFWAESDLGYELRDYNVVKGIYDNVLKFEEDWMKEVWGDEKEESKDE